MNSSDPDFERLKNYDFADARHAASFPHLVKLRSKQIRRAEQLHVEGYKETPAVTGEFDVWIHEQDWGEE